MSNCLWRCFKNPLCRAVGLVLLLVGCGGDVPAPPVSPPPPTSSPAPPTVTPAPLELPARFTAVEPARFGLQPADLSQPGLTVSEVVAFESERGEVLLGFWGEVSRQTTAAESLFAEPEAAARTFIEGFGGTGEAQPFPVDVGQQASGFRVDEVAVIVFQRGSVSAVLALLNGDEVTLIDAARRLDIYLQEGL